MVRHTYRTIHNNAQCIIRKTQLFVQSLCITSVRPKSADNSSSNPPLPEFAAVGDDDDDDGEMVLVMMK